MIKVSSIKAQKQWIHNKVSDEEITSLSESLNISKTLGGLLLRLGISDPNQAQRFLYPRLSHLSDPLKLTNMEVAVERIIRAIKNEESILILGDYDVDGVTSTALLTSILKYFGQKPQYVIPRRLEEGYGISKEVLARALKKSTPNLFIALDCGTNSVEEVLSLKSKGIDVIIVDHHQSKHYVPKDTILINPHVFDTPDKPWSHLCTVGLVFKLIHALVKVLRDEDFPKSEDLNLKDLLDLVALGTIADLVPLLEENRILTYFGLGKIQHNNRPGLHALCKVSGLVDGQPVNPSDIAFRLGPRINASGRLSDATLPVDMLLGTDFINCTKAAEQLNVMNRERQDIERDVTAEAERMVIEENQQENPVILVYSPKWHSGVVGIVAGKISRLYNRPTIVLGKEGQFAKGSSRSVPGINLVAALGECVDLLESWGGHPMAAGVALLPSNIKTFQKKFTLAVSKQLDGKQLQPSIEIAQFVTPEDLTEALLEELELLQPYGMNNPEPIFGLKNGIIPSAPKEFSNHHIRFQIERKSGLPLSCVGWKMATTPPPHGRPLNLAVKFAYNNWNGKKLPQIELIDWELP